MLRRPDISGQVIIEALIAINVLVLGFLGMFALLSRTLFLNKVTSNSYIGTYLAAEGLEIVKNIVDNNFLQGQAWNSGFSDGDFEVDYSSFAPVSFLNRPLSFDSSAGLYSYGAGLPTGFVRRIRIRLNGPDELQANSIVYWNTGLAQSSVNLEDRFFNWRPAPKK